MIRLIKIALVSLALAFAGQAPAFAAKSEIYTGFASDLAVGGYDTVAFFTEGAPTKGSKEYAMEYKGAVWRFASQENLDLFAGDPTAYAPQYGGYCAWAASQGYTAKGNPKFWTVYEDKLYLNYNGKVQKDWLVDVPGFIEKANANWPGILD
jgi:YHS domain-containing protein